MKLIKTVLEEICIIFLWGVSDGHHFWSWNVHIRRVPANDR
jgi:hypothetical protein